MSECSIIDVWADRPEPVIAADLQDRLTEVGGRIPDGCGYMSGKPMFVLAYGGTCKRWSNGKMRLRFLDRQRILKRQYAVAPDVYQRILAWGVKETEKLKAEGTLSSSFAVPEFTDYLTSEESSLNYVAFDADTNYQQAADMLNAGLITKKNNGVTTQHKVPTTWQYAQDVYFVHQIGRPYWYVLRWMPSPQPQKQFPFFGTNMDTRQQWDNNRYDRGFYPETQEEFIMDRLGPYPEFGDYEHEYLGLIHDSDPNIYVEPTADNILPAVREYISKRDNIRLMHMDKTFRTETDLNEDLRAHDMRSSVWSNDFQARFKDALPVGVQEGKYKGQTAAKIQSGNLIITS